MLKKYFHGIVTEFDHPQNEKPVLLIANHFSWWDGFIGHYLSFKYFRKKFHVMMLREQLIDRMFLNKAGAFSVEKSTRSVVESLHYSAEILSRENNLLMMFPQGKIESQYHRDFLFEKGVEKILERCDPLPEVVFNVNLVDYFSNPAPTLFIRTKSYRAVLSAKELQDAFNRFHSECLSKQHENLI
jgi:1-acyl-sn-glycerol-3-phosphate acyltransferase